METLRMEDSYSRDRTYEPFFDSPFATDDMFSFNADSGIFDMSIANLSANPDRSMDTSYSSYPNPDYTFNTNSFPCRLGYAVNNSFSEFDTSSGCQRSEIPVVQGLGTCQLSNISPSLESLNQSTSTSRTPPAATCPDLENDSRSHSECPSSNNSNYAHSNISNMGTEDASRSNETLQTESTKPRKKRGRKRANVSDEERRNRKLERGRVAANKCRQKKRARENDLESKGLELLIERDQMLKLNQELRDEIMGLQLQIMKHVGGECGGIPNAERIISSMNIPPERSDDVDRRKGTQLKNLLENQTL